MHLSHPSPPIDPHTRSSRGGRLVVVAIAPPAQAAPQPRAGGRVVVAAALRCVQGEGAGLLLPPLRRQDLLAGLLQGAQGAGKYKHTNKRRTRHDPPAASLSSSYQLTLILPVAAPMTYQTACTGRRDRFAPVPLSQFTDAQLRSGA